MTTVPLLQTHNPMAPASYHLPPSWIGAYLPSTDPVVARATSAGSHPPAPAPAQEQKMTVLQSELTSTNPYHLTY
ncbi:hypothetical protein P691DRAFT_762331 [Macrolepiota fuliginosa MF-IS2]|uniref:Uncharacterized protein n=1 Tax=Macrolepiota fuliginosa MF-IS2 TaxID=1400762 RepID=A0A9P5X6W0_9AGAR|nr:hypothetical protein P691DRAFT_762331 [Macrolepiota fuliginosa MF-IS2]